MSYSAEFTKVAQLIQSGKVPDDVRDDIDDSAPNPDAIPSQSQLPIPRKPWEKIEEVNFYNNSLTWNTWGPIGPRNKSATKTMEKKK